VALLDHQRVRRPHSVDDAVQVHVDDPLPVDPLHLVGRSADADARVVEHQVEPPVSRGDRLHQLLYGGRVGHVEVPAVDGALRARCRRFDQGRGRPGGGLIDVREHDVRALTMQLHAQCVPDPGRTSGDDRHLPREGCSGLPHVALPLLVEPRP
jgi:hypothetical protein